MTTITNVGQTGYVSGITPATTTSASPAASESSSLLPEPVGLSGDTITRLAMLMTKSDLQDQTNSTIIEDAANKAAAQDDAARVQQMMDKANQDLGQALATGLGEVAGGALSIAAAVVPAGATGSPGGSTATAPITIGADRGLAGVLSGAGKAAPGIGTIVSAPFKANGDRDDAQAAKYQAASDADVRRYNQAQNVVQADADAASKLEQAVQGILQTQQATSLKAAGGP
jgi:hypothetical protein